MVAAEASGDLLAASVLAGLAARCGPDRKLTARGIGGPAMGGQGFDAWWSIDELSVRGRMPCRLLCACVCVCVGVAGWVGGGGGG